MGTWPFGTRGTFSSTAATVSISPVSVRWRSNGPWRRGSASLAAAGADRPVDPRRHLGPPAGRRQRRPHQQRAPAPTRADGQSEARHDQGFPSPRRDNRPPTPGDR